MACLVFLKMAFSFIKLISSSDTSTNREVAILKICPSAIITSPELIIAEYDTILGRWKRKDFYNHPSNYTNLGCYINFHGPGLQGGGPWTTHRCFVLFHLFNHQASKPNNLVKEKCCKCVAQFRRPSCNEVSFPFFIVNFEKVSLEHCHSIIYSMARALGLLDCGTTEWLDIVKLLPNMSYKIYLSRRVFCS